MSIISDAQKFFKNIPKVVNRNFGFTDGRFNPVAQTRALMSAPAPVAQQFRQQANRMTPKIDVSRLLPPPSSLTPKFGTWQYGVLNAMSKAQPLAAGIVNEPLNAIAGAPFGLAKLPSARTKQQALADVAQFAQGPLAYAGMRIAPKPILSQGAKASSLLQAGMKGFKQAAPWGAAYGALSGLQAGENKSLPGQLFESGKQAVGYGIMAGGVGGAGAVGAQLPQAFIRSVVKKLHPKATPEQITIMTGNYLRDQKTGQFVKNAPKWQGRVTELDQSKLDKGDWPTRGNPPKINAEIDEYLKKNMPKPGLVTEDNGNFIKGLELSQGQTGKLKPGQLDISDPLNTGGIGGRIDGSSNTNLAQVSSGNSLSQRVNADDLVKEGRKILESLPREMRASHLFNYSNELVKRGFTRSQVERISAPEGAAILKNGVTPIQRFGNELTSKAKTTQNPNMRFLQDVGEEVRAAKDPYQLSKTIDEAIKTTEVKNKVNVLDYLRTPNRVFKKIGLENEGKLLREKYDDYLIEVPKEIDKVTQWSKRVPKDSNERIFDYLDGKQSDLSLEEMKVATEIKAYLKDWAVKLKLPEDKQISNYITHIFPKGAVEKEFDPEIARLIRGKVTESVYDPFLQKRVGKPEYRKDTWAALDAYAKRATRKFHMDQALAGIEAKAERLPEESYNYVKGRIARINMQPTDLDNLIDNLVKSSPVGYKLGQRPVTAVSQTARQAVFRGLLGLNPGSALRNLQQSTNTYAVLGEKHFGIGLMKTVQSLPRFLANKDTELEKVGVLGKDIIQDRTLNATHKFWENADKGLFYMFQQAEKWNRGIAYYGAKSQGLSKGMDEQAAIKYAKEIVGKTQFNYDVIDTPAALQSDIMKTLFQFGKYPLAQTEFLTEMVKNKNVAGSLRWLGSNILFVATAGKLLGLDDKDMFPQMRFGVPPTLQGPVEIGKALVNAPDKYGGTSDEENPVKRVYDSNEVRRGLLNYVPAGGQIKKSWEGINAYNEGASLTPSGRTRFEVEQTPENLARAAAFGQYTLPGAKEYIGNLGKSQTEVLYNKLQKLKSPEEKKQLLRQMQKDGKLSKENVNELKQRYVEEEIGITPQERKMKNLGVENGARAKIVVKQLKGLKSKEEKIALYKKYSKAKIITKEVDKQVRYLMTH